MYHELVFKEMSWLFLDMQPIPEWFIVIQLIALLKGAQVMV